MKRSILLILLLMFTFASVSLAQERNMKTNMLSGSLMIGVDAGMTIGKTDYSDIRPDILGRARLDYYFPTTSSGIFGLRAFTDAGYVSGKDVNETPTIFRTNIFAVGGGVTYTLSIKDAVFPYAFAGAEYLNFNPKDENRNVLPRNAAQAYKKNEGVFLGEIGVHFMVAEALALDLSIGADFSPNDNWDDVAKGGDNDFLIRTMAGFSYTFFTNKDTDGDGVLDSKDQCPDTPPGVRVDDFGCAVDTDGDGVPDYKDKCPNTKRGMEVDENGCATDSDNDGVPDKVDKCPNTPAGMQVNEDGCPDTDNDGVADNNDKCPNTPKGAAVDANGCPKDTDNDGVPDYQDKCPNTPAGKQVDENGCAKEVVQVQKKMVLSGDTNFEFNKSALLPNAYSTLDKIAKSIKSNPNTEWSVEGYTDAVGSESYNMKLSRERAQSVVDYLVSKGVDRDKLQVVGKGESNPIATNSTAEGRAMNRRVEIRLVESGENNNQNDNQ